MSACRRCKGPLGDEYLDSCGVICPECEDRPVIERGGGRPAAYTDNGVKLPGVTSILSAVIAKPALVNWAYRRGVARLDLYSSRDAAADIGGAVHDAVEEYEYSGTRPTFEQLRNHAQGEEKQAPRDAARAAFEAYLNWRWVQAFEVRALEVPLVSAELGYAGTLDMLAVRDGVLTIIDLKTSGAVYPEYALQVAAYANLWEAVRGDRVERFEIIRTPKDDVPFDHFSWTREAMAPAFRAWDHAFSLYRLQNDVKGLVTPPKTLKPKTIKGAA